MLHRKKTRSSKEEKRNAVDKYSSPETHADTGLGSGIGASSPLVMKARTALVRLRLIYFDGCRWREC